MANAGDRGWGPPGEQPIVTVGLPSGVQIPVARRIAPLVEHLSHETLRQGYEIKSGQTWGYCFRKIRGGTTWSNHAWGVAVDINSLPPNHMHKPPANAARSDYTDHPEWMVQLWKQHGFGWGGDYRTTKDAMHYEFLGTPAQADALVRGLGQAPVAEAARASGSHVCEKGDRCARVREIQQILTNAGMYSSPIDGVFGPKTEAGVRAWQQKLRLTADGRWGPKTDRATVDLFRLASAMGQ